MNIREIHENKKQFLPLLLLADEQEDMIDRYLERGTMYVLEDGGDPQQLPRTLFPYPEFFTYEEGFWSSRTSPWNRRRRERATARR